MSDLPKPSEVLPHRQPLLMLDEVLEAGDKTLRAARTFRADEHFFRGHFPGNPIVPGVLLVEGMAQAFAYMITRNAPATQMLLTGIERARFRKPVLPEQRVEFLVELTGERLGMLRGRGEARVEGERVADAVLTGLIKTR